MRRLSLSILILVGLFASSCNDTPSTSIPYVYVYLECNLTQAQFASIKTPNQFVAVFNDAKNIPVGYAGILVGQSPFNGYCAYDMCCPVEADRKIAVKLNNNAVGIARCDKCGEEYDLLNGAYPMKGIGKEYLKRYNVTISGVDLLFVHN